MASTETLFHRDCRLPLASLGAPNTKLPTYHGACLRTGMIQLRFPVRRFLPSRTQR